MTLKDACDSILAFAPHISSDPLSGARHAPEPWAVKTQCFSNAERKANESGGTAFYGWYFHFRNAVSLPGRSYVIAAHHAVWCAPDNALIDVTPFHADPNHRPIVVNGGTVLFLVDQVAAPLKATDVGLALPSWFFPVAQDADLAAYLTKLEHKELDNWEEQVAQIHALKASPRADIMLRSRRARLSGLGFSPAPGTGR